MISKVHLGCWNSTQSILAWLQAEGKGDKEEVAEIVFGQKFEKVENEENVNFVISQSK